MGDGLAQQPLGLLEAASPEDRPDRGPDQLLGVLGAVAEGVAQEMDGAALPRGTQHLGNRLFEALVGVGDHQLHPGKAAADQRTQELPPERLGLGSTHIHADDLALAGMVHAVGDHQRSVLDPPAGPHLLDLGVQPQVRMAPSKGRSRNAVTCSSSPRHNLDTWSLPIPASPRASTSRSTLRVDTPLT